MPGASGASGSTRWPARRRARAPSTRSISLARQAARPQQQRLGRGRRRWWIRRRPASARRRRSGRCGRRDRPARARRWSARRGRSGWRRAPPPAGRARAGCRAPPDGRAPAPRCCRGRRSRARRPGSRRASRSTSVSGPGQNAAASRSAAASNTASRRAAGDVGDVRDQRIERRPALGGVEPRDRRAVGGVGAEPIDRLGRERDQAAVREAARRVGDRRGVGGQRRGSTSSLGHRPCARRVLRAAAAWRACGSLGRVDLHPVELALGLRGSAAARTAAPWRARSQWRVSSRNFSRISSRSSGCSGVPLKSVDAARQRAAVLERHRDGRGERVAVLGLVGDRDRHARGQRADRRIVERAWR